MTWTTDYSADWQFIDGVTDGTYTPPGGSGSAVKVLRDRLTRRDLSGGPLGIDPTDVPWVVWLLSADAQPQGTLAVGSDTFTVISNETRADGAQQRLICRKQV